MKLILATLALVLSTQAHAVYIPDAIYTTMRCERLVDIPDLGLGVEVRTGGIAGRTQVVINEFYITGSNTHSQFVQSSIQANHALYNNENLSLDVDFGAELDAKGGLPGKLHAVLPNNQVIETMLSCQSVMHIM